jgi:succinate dehydrogenase / fumarate reductase cytochrome b subunit
MSTTTPTRTPVSGTAVTVRRRRPFLLDLYSTAVGKKYAMAVSGIALMGFVLFHMIGNLKMYLGEADLNEYAEFLKKLLYPLHAAWSLTVLNRKARPVRYQSARDYQEASLASRSMRLTGIVVLLFVVWHLLDLTFGVVNTVGTDGVFDRQEVYANVVRSFERWPVAVFYIVANVLLGVWSIFQSLGWNNPRFNAWRVAFARGFAAIIVIGNVSFPIAVLAGIVSV